jgi:hypothetical protein
MSVRVRITNLNDVLASFDATEDKFEQAVQYAVTVTGLAVEKQAKQNASGRPGPNVRTGNLRRSITTSNGQKGFDGSYSVDVSATMVYSRAVEFGHPKWKPGVKYPYLGPAAEKLSANGTLSRVFSTNLAMRMRGN